MTLSGVRVVGPLKFSKIPLGGHGVHLKILQTPPSPPPPGSKANNCIAIYLHHGIHLSDVNTSVTFNLAIKGPFTHIKY